MDEATGSASGGIGSRGELTSYLLEHGFPIDPKPYCVIAREAPLGLSESDVLEAVLGLRMDGTFARLGATFDASRCTDFTNEELELVELLAGDLPMSEDPYAEVAAELVRRGVETDEAWVLERTESWAESGVIESVGPVVAGE